MTDDGLDGLRETRPEPCCGMSRRREAGQLVDGYSGQRTSASWAGTVYAMVCLPDVAAIPPIPTHSGKLFAAMPARIASYFGIMTISLNLR